MTRLPSLCLPFIVLFLLAACGGASSPAEVARPLPAAEQRIEAHSLKFDKRAVAVPANTQVTVHFVNNDDGLLHNFSVYAARNAREKVYVGELVTGRKTIDYTFTSPGPGTYYFRCDAHPDMNGTFYVDEPAG